MARFGNLQSPAVHAPSSIGPNPIQTRTAQGGVGYIASDAHIELFNAAVNGFLADNFYEKADVRIKRLISLVPQCDPAWLRGFIPWLRSAVHLRSAPVVLAAEYVRAGFPNGRYVVSAALQRADEPGELLAYWYHTYGREGLPSRLKRGISDACQRLYTERAVLKYDGTSKNWRFGDVIEVAHCKPRYASNQSALYKFCLDRRRHDPRFDRLALPMIDATLAIEALPPAQRSISVLQDRLANPNVALSWERASGWLGTKLDKAGWEALLPTMGYFAVLRNLNNFERSGVDYKMVSAVLTDAEGVASSRVMPFRFLTAYKSMETDTYLNALAEACDLSLVNLPEFGGMTLIMVDVSGSMDDPLAGEHSVLKRSEIAGFFAEALARRCARSEVWTYTTDRFGHSLDLNRIKILPHASVLRGANRDVYAPRQGTYTWASTETVLNQMVEAPDRIIVITDEQSNDSDRGTIRQPVITWNVAGYKVHQAAHNAHNRLFVAGVSDLVMQTLPARIAHGTSGTWPWEMVGSVD